MKAYLLGLVDRRVEEVFAACALHTIRCSSEDLLALANSSSSQPDVVILDLRDGSAIPPSVATLKRQHPTTGVLILASRLDPAVMLEAMRAQPAFTARTMETSVATVEPSRRRQGSMSLS